MDVWLDSNVHDWRWHLGITPGAEQPEFDDSKWELVDLGFKWWPHDSTGWFRPGEGCEAANFGLGQFPATLNTPRGVIRTGLTGWHWSSFCKTQSASDPGCGGVPQFLRCHLTVIAMLDRAKELGCLERVSDEGGLGEKRELPALVQEIGSWNEMIAAFGGK